MRAFKKAIKDFYFHCEYEKNLTTKTMNAYRIDLRQFQEFLTEQTKRFTDLNTIDKHVLRAYLKKISDQCKPKTVKRKIATLKVFFNFLELEDTIIVSPFRKMRVKIILEDRLPVVMTLQEISRLFTYLYDQAATLPTTQLRPRQRLFMRDIAILEMLFATGMRVGELTQLRKTDIDLESGSVRIFGKGRKERLLPLTNRQTMRTLSTYTRLFRQQLTKSPTFFISVLGTPITEQSIRILVEKHVKNAGITKKVTPHTFRHTVATLLLENGVDIRNIQNLLGHSDITTTQLYAKVNTEAQRELLAVKHPRELV